MGYLIKLVKIARPYWKYLIIAAFSMLTITELNLLGPWLVRNLTGIITAAGKYPNARKTIINISLILILSYILRIVFQFLNSYFSHYAAWHLVADVRTKVYEKLQSLSFGYFVDKQVSLCQEL